MKRIRVVGGGFLTIVGWFWAKTAKPMHSQNAMMDAFIKFERFVFKGLY